jgi:methionyl-tRNA formyltransferase
MVDVAPRLAYAGNRAIGIAGLGMLLDLGWEPSALILPGKPAAEGVEEMKALVPRARIIERDDLASGEALPALRGLGLDYLLSVHYPHKLPAELVAMPSLGTLNLHPAWLPYNRGWHTPSWAILDQTPYGATLHFVDEGIDTGDIALRRPLPVAPSDTAHSLYQRVLRLEQGLLREALPLMMERRLPRMPQGPSGTSHTKRELGAVQTIDLSQVAPIGQVIDRLRALTTSRREEAAYFETAGRRYRVRVEIEEITDGL